MGERERRDSQRVLEHKPILDIKRWRLMDYILYPYRAWKEKKRQEELRKSLFRVSESTAFNEVEEQNYLSTLDKLIDEADKENKGDK